jgi:hypothetical protein
MFWLEISELNDGLTVRVEDLRLALLFSIFAASLLLSLGYFSTNRIVCSELSSL